MRKYLFILSLSAVVGLSTVSCSDKDNDGLGDIDKGSGTMETMTPEESKKFLEETATTALNMLNPEDQKDVIQLCSYFLDNYGDLDLPENFEVEEETRSFLNEFFSESANAIASADPSYLTRAAVDYVYNIDFENFKGIYQPGKYEWEKIGDSNDVIFKFTGITGQNCELKATGSSNYYDTSFEWTDEDYYYGSDTSQYNFHVPAQVNVTLSEGNTKLATCQVNSKVNFASHNFTVDCQVKVANITAEAKTEGNDSKVTETATTTVNGTKYIYDYAVATGSHLCDIDFYNKNFGNNSDYATAFSQMFSQGEATVNVLDKVSVDGTIQYTYALYDALGLYADSVVEAEAYVALLNNNIKGQVRYNNTTTVQATIGWSYTAEKYSWGTEYQIEPQLIFPDGTSYYFTKYFETGFSGVENLWNSLTKKYEAIWDAVR